MPVLPIEAQGGERHDFEAVNLVGLSLDAVPAAGGVLIVGRHRTGVTEVRLVDRGGSLRRRVHELLRQSPAILGGEEGSNFLGWLLMDDAKRREGVYLEVKSLHDPAAMRGGRVPRALRATGGLPADGDQAFPTG